MASEPVVTKEEKEFTEWTPNYIVYKGRVDWFIRTRGITLKTFRKIHDLPTTADVEEFIQTQEDKIREAWENRQDAWTLVELVDKFLIERKLHEKVMSTNPTVYVEVRFLKDAPSIIGSDLKVYGPFTAEKVYALPKENTRIFIKTGMAVATREEAKKPTLKEMFKGEVLDGYIEAAITKPLVEEEDLSAYVREELAALGLPDEEIEPETARIVREASLQPNPKEFADKELKIVEEREIAKLEEEEKPTDIKEAKEALQQRIKRVKQEVTREKET